MNIACLIFFFIFGSIIGSFLNVVLFRYNTGRGVGGRSKCFSCRRTLSAIDLVPVLSYAAFGGRCRTCKSHISAQYPAVELLTALLFAASYALYAPLLFLNPTLFAFKVSLALVVMSILVLITVYDIRHKIIPDSFAFLFAGISFVAMFVSVGMHGELFVTMPSMPHLFAGVILAFPFYFLWLISRGTWMGLGDAKLALGIGWFLGLTAGATAIVYGFWIGAAVSIILLALQKAESRRAAAHSHGKGGESNGKLFGIFKVPNLSMKSEIPFAPFLILGLLIVYFFQYNMFSILEHF